MTKNIVLVLVFTMLASCTKQELTSVNGNNSPDDLTISNATKNNYINRLYIKLLDRKPDSVEFNSSLDILNQDPKSQSKRKEVINQIRSKPEYHIVLWKSIRDHLIDGVDTTDIRYLYDEIVEEWGKASGSNKEILEYEYKRLEKLLMADIFLKDGSYNWQELQKHTCNNIIYDDINMGSENFVVSVFQNLFLRYPTNQELSNAKNMVDGRSSVLFLVPGDDKEDFLNIVFNSNAYYEGQANILLSENLFRSPQSSELVEYTNIFMSNQDFDELYLELLSSEIYFML